MRGCAPCHSLREPLICTFRSICQEDTALTLKEGATKVFLNAAGVEDDVQENVKIFSEIRQWRVKETLINLAPAVLVQIFHPLGIDKKLSQSDRLRFIRASLRVLPLGFSLPFLSFLCYNSPTY